MIRSLYLHGFASGPDSSKGRFFQTCFESLGLKLVLPDLTAGQFEYSTLTRQLQVLERLAGRPETLLIGSSMGGYLAALYVARYPKRVRALVLLAPAFGLARRWGKWIGEEAMEEWKRTGWCSTYHYGRERESRISYELISDGLQYEDFPEITQPTLIFHGRNDDTVDYRLSEQFAAGRPNVELILLDSDHQMLASLQRIWERVQVFLKEQGVVGIESLSD